MKILINTLLLAIVICLYICELNASDRRPSSSGSPAKRGRPPRSGRGEFRVHYRTFPSVEGPPNLYATYKGKKIEIVTDPTGKIALRAECPENSIPAGHEYRNRNFLVRLTIIEGIKVVEYVNQNNSLMGVREPRPTTANTMEPNDTEWFVVYQGKYFRVKQNPYTANPEEISLIPENEHKADYPSERATVAGFTFLVFREAPYAPISGAALPPEEN